MPSRHIDWEAIHLRLAAATDAISGGLAPSREAVASILQARARVAARPPIKPDDAERLELLVFSLAAESYAVETRHVREVCQLGDLTPVPCTPSFVAGVMSLRGHVLAVLDLRKFFELPTRGLTELNRVVVLQGRDSELGLLADSVDGVRVVAATELQEGLTTLTGIRERFLKGVTAGMLAVLDGDRLLADAALKVDEQVSR